MAQFQLATNVRRFKMLNVLDVVRIHSFCFQCLSDSQSWGQSCRA